MKRLEKLLDKALWRTADLLHKYAPARVRMIDVDGERYLMRLYITPRAWPKRFYLHYFFRGDGDRELHNHPWDRSTSLILVGGYREERWDPAAEKVTVREFGPGSVNRLEHNTFHRVDLVAGGCWTLFCSEERIQDWGFLDVESGEYMSHAEYLGE